MSSTLQDLLAWSITAQLKAGYKIPIPKKGKDPLMQDNHSGITITNLFGKLLEHLIQAESGDDILADQHDLQCGFTANMSLLLPIGNHVPYRNAGGRHSGAAGYG